MIILARDDNATATDPVLLGSSFRNKIDLQLPFDNETIVTIIIHIRDSLMAYTEYLISNVSIIRDENNSISNIDDILPSEKKSNKMAVFEELLTAKDFDMNLFRAAFIYLTKLLDDDEQEKLVELIESMLNNVFIRKTDIFQ